MRINIRTLLVLFLIPTSLGAAESVGKVVFVKGKAQVVHVQPQETKELSFNDPIFPMDALETKDGELKILFDDQTVMALSRDSKVLITEQVYKPKQGVRKSIFDILKGKVRTIVERVPGSRDNEVQLQTPTAVAGIRGTDVGTYVHGNTTQFLCFDGLIETYFKGLPEQKVMVESGHQTTIQSSPPTTPETIPQNAQGQYTRQEGSPLKEVLKQSGAEGLNKKEFLPPPPPQQSANNERNQNNGNQQNQRNNQPQNIQPRNQQQPQPQNNPGTLQNMPPPPPPPPPILPGGTYQTPIELIPPGAAGAPGPTGGGAGSGPTAPTTAPVDVPVTFPSPG